MLPRSLVTIALATCWAGCGTVATETWLNEPLEPMAPRRPHRVELYASAPPSRPHTDVALIEVEQTRGLNERGTSLMIRRLLEKAGAMGCDAVLVGGMREREGVDPSSAWSLLDPGATTLQGVCMVYNTDETVLPFRARVAEQPTPRSPAIAGAVHQRVDSETPR